MSAEKSNMLDDGPETMPDEYPLDHSEARPNRFAGRVPSGRVVGVVLEPDVAEVFQSSEAVNRFLPSAIQAMSKRDEEDVGKPAGPARSTGLEVESAPSLARGPLPDATVAL